MGYCVEFDFKQYRLLKFSKSPKMGKTPESFIFGLFENFKSLYCLESNSTQYRLLKFSKSPKMKLSGVLHTFDFLCKTQKIDFSKQNILYRGTLPPGPPV